MRLTIFHKLFISLMLISSIMMIGMALLINNSFQNGFQRYLNQSEVERIENMAENISDYYSSDQGWYKLQQQPELWRRLLRNIGEHPRKPKKVTEMTSRKTRSNYNQLTPRLNLLDINGNTIIGAPKNFHRLHANIQITKVAITKNEQTIGWLSILQRENIKGHLAERFLRQQLDNFYWIAAWAALFSFIVAALLVRHFLKPLKKLHSAAKSLSNGNFDYQIDVRGKDELAELSLAFNLLTTTLKTQKLSREQWLADISHELRTPIAVLLSEIEAIEDGIRKPEPKYIKSLHNQVITLTRLVDDLYSLSQSDNGVLIDTSHNVDITNIINNIANQNEVRLADKHIAIQRLYDHRQPMLLNADAKSLAQLIGNLFENSYRYTDQNGQIKINLQQTNDSILLTIEDSAPAVPDAALPKLFERLYRVDKSRSRANGGSGLGLSICENIIKRHNGHISAQHSKLGGLKIAISLPIKDN
ncbi:ATP-binding protein [Moritella viscosa]|uniref:histidine kinase n=1 Tax=Moritella viscosa TaxID=80854 RepID=A0ABY1HA03_9GAMM|nr:ATP-binding protein [Moritella viscosa]CED61117.1 sensor protein, histidine kinase [Moritella viscosa]SGY87810.1 Sensory transduction histidine kinase [Moritella viscosa]SGY87881.1 Sensory transduction histidine kinase [Moritella viscosa]SGY90886.1 Sensory transduction histidine kinase [Moritella viscosa]SHN99725.1 Sensory transduction histidine kinase [Moritella viscosa]